MRWSLKIFDRFYTPFAEYCLRTTLTEEELKKAFAAECPRAEELLSWKKFRASLGIEKQPVFSIRSGDPLVLRPVKSVFRSRNGLATDIVITCESAFNSSQTILHIKLSLSDEGRFFELLACVFAAVFGILAFSAAWWLSIFVILWFGWIFVVLSISRSVAAEGVQVIQKDLAAAVKTLEEKYHPVTVR